MFLNWRHQTWSYISSQCLHFCWCCWLLSSLCITGRVVGQPQWGVTAFPVVSTAGHDRAPVQDWGEPSWLLPVGHWEEHLPLLLDVLHTCMPVVKYYFSCLISFPQFISRDCLGKYLEVHSCVWTLYVCGSSLDFLKKRLQSDRNNDL